MASKKKIIEWAMVNIPETGYGVDAVDMATHCWRCAYERETEKCHVVPKSRGGEDLPSNYRLLCQDCHLENPNVKDPDEMDKWIRKTNVGMYNIFWKLRKIAEETRNDTCEHWGTGKLNNATRMWIANEFMTRCIKEFGYYDERFTNVLRP